MSLLVLHLRWNDVGPEQYAELCLADPDDGPRPPACLSRKRHHQGRAVLGSEVWDDGREADLYHRGLSAQLALVGVGEAQRVVFAIPECYAAPYRRSRTASPAAEPVLEAAPEPVVVPPRSPVSGPLPADPPVPVA